MFRVSETQSQNSPAGSFIRPTNCVLRRVRKILSRNNHSLLITLIIHITSLVHFVTLSFDSIQKYFPYYIKPKKEVPSSFQTGRKQTNSLLINM